ncbi:hypothetical protein EYF80_008014 [Liparis tanakae]|uniref:Uncharacterized protein n=1 Tax=Liparis tanakae TaxID=230148 RepID=A0A4Z2IU81_9TELE|nr:hypothetical protein EYF80_008014 [Liparis tanakae]
MMRCRRRAWASSRRAVRDTVDAVFLQFDLSEEPGAENYRWAPAGTTNPFPQRSEAKRVPNSHVSLATNYYTQREECVKIWQD